MFKAIKQTNNGYEFRAHYQSLVFWVAYCRSLFVVLSFYLLAILLSVLLPFMASDWLHLWNLQFILEYILYIIFRGKNRYHAYVISDICCRPYNYSHVETPYKVISSVNIICFHSDYYHVSHVLYSYEIHLDTDGED